MSSLSKARIHSLDGNGNILEDIDVYTSGDAVTMDNARTLEDIYTNDIGNSSTLTTTSKKIVGAINEVVSRTSDIAVFAEQFTKQILETNDSARIKRAIDYAIAKGIQTIRFAPIKYTIGEKIVIPDGIKLIGQGYNVLGMTGTILERTADIVAIECKGISMLQQNHHAVPNVEFTDILFSGGSWSYTQDFMYCEATYNMLFRKCTFRGMGGRQLYLREVMDSRFENCIFVECQSTDISKPAVELASGNGFEYTNEIQFVGCRWENNKGVSLAGTGTNTNEIYFTNCKFENNGSNTKQIYFENAGFILCSNVNVCTKGEIGQTIESQIEFVNCTNVSGNFAVEHIASGATMNYSVVISGDTSRDIHLNLLCSNVTLYNTNNPLVNVNIASYQKDKITINPPVLNNKKTSNLDYILLNKYLNIQHAEGVNIRDPLSPCYTSARMIPITGNERRFSLISNDGVGGGDKTILYVKENGNKDVILNTPLSLSTIYLMSSSTEPWGTGTLGSMYFDSNLNAYGIYGYGSYRHMKIKYDVAYPTSGTWGRGDRVINPAPAVGYPKSWVCTVAGTPGTWVSEGNL